MRIDPGLLSSIVDGLAGRVRKRAEALLAAGVEVSQEVSFGNATVRIVAADVVGTDDDLVCDCLLAPACAHRAAVALALPIAAGDDLVELAEPDGNDQSTGKDDELADGGDSAGAARLTPDQLVTIRVAWEHLEMVLQLGADGLPATIRSGLAADLHRMRAHALITADRALTGFVSSLGQGERISIDPFAAVLMNLHSLTLAEAGTPVLSDLLGRARTPYRGVGGLILHPLVAEPVHTSSGFGGVNLTFTDTSSRVWHLSRVIPGDASMVAKQYVGGEPWGGITEPLKVLARRRVMVLDATASSAGRLGGGKQVRAAVQGPWPGWDELPSDYQVVAGRITGGDRRGLVVDGRRLQLTSTAVGLGAGLGTELFGATADTQVRCLVRVGELLGVQIVSGPVELPDELAGVWWPGLDQVSRDWVRGELPDLDTLEALDPADWRAAVPAVSKVTTRWLERSLAAGPKVFRASAVDRDLSWLRAAGAPFAAELLAGLVAASRLGERRFDGGWQPDAKAYAMAWLALSQY